MPASGSRASPGCQCEVFVRGTPVAEKFATKTMASTAAKYRISVCTLQAAALAVEAHDAPMASNAPRFGSVPALSPGTPASLSPPSVLL